MGIVALFDPRARLAVRGGALQIVKGEAIVETLRTEEVAEVQIYGKADLTAAARNLLLHAGIDVVFLTADGRWRGRLSGAESRAGRRRLAQYATVSDPARRLAIAASLVAGKIANQRALLLSRQVRLRSEGIAGVLALLRSLEARLGEARDLDALRGLEGTAARHYFDGFGAALTNPLFTFAGRVKRPPTDPVNAALSYGYTLLLLRVEHAVRAAGLDPYLGLLHEPARGGAALAFDLMEELRPVVDGLVLTLVNRKQLSPEDFRVPPAEELGDRAELAERAVYLGEVGRKILLGAWQRTLNEPMLHPGRASRWKLRDLIREQAQQMARVMEGEQDTWRPLLLRA